MADKEVSKALMNLGLVGKMLNDIEKMVEDIEKSVLTSGNFATSIDFSHLLKGQITMAMYIRRKLSERITKDYKKNVKE